MTHALPRWPVVIFDLDGTLADTIGLIVASYNHAFRTVLGSGTERDAAEIRRWIGRPLLESFEAISPDHAIELDRVYREWNIAHTADFLREYPGVREILHDLEFAGARLGIVTSKRRQTALLAMRGVGIEDVPLVGALEDTVEHKPRPAPLLHGAAALGADPGNCVYVGDAVVDIQAARAAGMGAIAVSWGAGRRQDLAAAGPDALVDTAADLGVALLDEAAA